MGGGYPGETIEALWSLVWRGLLTNDALHALRAYCEKSSNTQGRNAKPVRRVHNQAGFRSRRTTPPVAQGRWSLNAVAFPSTAQPPILSSRPDTQAGISAGRSLSGGVESAVGERPVSVPAVNFGAGSNTTAWSYAIAQQLLTRYGVVFRETAHAEGLPGGFSAVYDVLKALEESGKIRRGYFAADLGGTQFALPAAVDLLRALRSESRADAGRDEKREVVMLAATDPANPYGTLLRWPAAPEEGSSLTRSVGARVVLVEGALTVYLRRGNPNLQVLLPVEEPARGQVARALAEFFVATVQRAGTGEDAERGARAFHDRGGLLITSINGVPVAEHPFARFLLDAGFQAAPMGFNVRRGLPGLPGREVRAQ